jgi:hypothetical protein
VRKLSAAQRRVTAQTWKMHGATGSTQYLFSYPKLVFLMEESVVDIGPKLLEDGGACIDQNVCHP